MSTLNDRLEAYFRAHAGEWITMQELAKVAGLGGWRTRVSNLRRQRGMQFENRVYRKDGYTISEYKFTPDRVPLEQAS